MEGRANRALSSSKETVVLDVKPVRGLAPMVPAPFGFTQVSPPGDTPFVCISPFGPFPSDFQSGHPSGFSPVFPSYAPPQPPINRSADEVLRPNNDGPTHVGEASSANSFLHSPSSISPSLQTPTPFIVPVNKDAGIFNGPVQLKQPLHLGSYKKGGSETEGTDRKKLLKPKRPTKANEHNLMMLPSLSEDPRESVEVILMTFDAIRRRLLQLEEANNLSSNSRPNMKAGTIMMDNDLRANKGKRIGSVPGVDVGDIFYLRVEICLVGLHAPIMGGIDYMNTKLDNEDETMAVSIVSSGGYEDETEDVDVLIYTGQGGKLNEKKQADDQKLERGNLALERSLHRANEIRVIRGTKDLSVPNGKIYIYDGLYKIHGIWVERGKSGFNLFKYKLLREPRQPDSSAIWKLTEKWKENPSARGGVILSDMSSGDENLPVCLVNEVDSEKGPGQFSYATKVKYLRPLSPIRPFQACTCRNVCHSGDANCSCARQNGGELPYGSNGFLVSRKPLIFECSASCQCSVNCRNRVTQKGIKLHFEVFRTRDRGWGLRSWDPIRTGAFICEYTGEIIDKVKVGDDGEEDEYIFETSHSDEKTFKWNYGPELMGELGLGDSGKPLKPLPIIISAKKSGNVSRFMNHSCSPNVFWQPVQHDHGDEGYHHIMFFAMKHIPPMTELTYDYGLSGSKLKKCLCGWPKCHGFFS